MVSMADICSSNAALSSSLPPGLVGLFVGATSGIGAGTLKAFAKYTRRPRAYFVGRSQAAADLIVAECQTLNPEGEYIFIPADVSRIRVVDEVCAQIRAKEPELNILFLSQGVPSMDRSETSESLHLLTALLHYSRARFIAQLLPLLQRASTLRRAVTVAASGFEGPVDSSDFAALRIPIEQIRGHVTSLITLTIEALAKNAPEVSFIHDYPGAVDTPLSRSLLRIGDRDVRVPAPENWMTPEESGERHLFLLTSGRYPPAESTSGPVGFVRGTNGQLGSGVYAIGLDGESVSDETLEFVAGLRRDGLGEQVWQHTESEFKRITEGA